MNRILPPNESHSRDYRLTVVMSTKDIDQAKAEQRFQEIIDGTWELTAADGEPVTVRMVEGLARTIADLGNALGAAETRLETLGNWAEEGNRDKTPSPTWADVIEKLENP